MSEHAGEMPSSRGSHEHLKSVVDFPTLGTIRLDGQLDDEHGTLTDTEVVMRHFDDATMSDKEIELTARKLSLPHILHGVNDATEQPRAIVEALLSAAQVRPSSDVIDRAAQRIVNRSDWEKKNPAALPGKKTPRAATRLEEEMVDYAARYRTDILRAGEILDRLRDDPDKFKLFDTLDDWEEDVKKAYGHSNLIRIYNELDHKVSGRDPRMMIARRLLITMLRYRLTFELTEPE